MGGTPRSGAFGCNVEAVEATARQLRDVVDELQRFDTRDDAYAGALASQRIGSALDHFHDTSSDQRGKIKDSADAVGKMLQGLADGVREVDRALADSLPDASQGSPSTRPATV